MRCLLIGLLLAGCVSGPGADPEVVDPVFGLPDTRPSAGALRVVVTPIAGDLTRRAADLFGAYLREELGRPVRVDVAQSYDEVAARITRPRAEPNAADVAVLSPLAFVHAREDTGLVPLASASSRGSPTYVGYLVVRADAELRSVQDLRGARVAYVHPLSTSGYLYPRALLRWRGLDPDAHLGEELHAGDHVSALRAVVEGEVDVAAVSSTYVAPGRAYGDVAVDGLRVVAKTERIPLDAVVARADLPRATALAVRAALFALERRPEHAEPLLRAWGFAAFEPYVARRYDRIAEVMRGER